MDVYKAASNARLIGTVEATDADVAIEKAAQEFKVEAKKADRSAAVAWRAQIMTPSARSEQ